MRVQVLSLVHKLKSTSTASVPSSGRNNGGEDRDGDLVVSAEEFVRFAGGEYEATEAAQGRLRRVLQLAGEKEGVTLEAAFGALDKVRFAFFRRGAQTQEPSGTPLRSV